MSGYPDGLSIRHDAWEAFPGAWRFLFLVAKGRFCACFLLALDPATMAWTEGRAVLPGWAFEIDRDLFERGVAMRPATRELVEFLGGFAVDDRKLFSRIEMTAAGMKSLVPDAGDEVSRRDDPWALPSGSIELPSGGRAGSGPDGVLTSGSVTSLPDEWASRIAPEHESGRRLHVPKVAMMMDGYVSGIAAWQHSATLWDWSMRLNQAVRPTVIRFVEPGHWKSEIHAFFMDAERGEYRRQAGEAYPFLAHVIAGDARLARCIDAGRPYEGRLTEILAGQVPERLSAGLTQAKLRRLRGMRREMGPVVLRRLLDLAARLPLHLVEPVAVAWCGRLGDAMQAASDWTDRHGLDPADVMKSFEYLDPDRARMALVGATDMAMNFSYHLLQPHLESRSVMSRERIAGRIMFGGRSLDAALALSKRWHGNLSRFEDALPEGRDVMSWPALFEPYVPPDRDDVMAVCLTKPSELKAEGSFGSDAVLGEGLRHCIAGYGPDCHSGGKHVVSIRKRVGDAWRRVSTAELVASVSRVRGKEVSFRLIQHQAAGNSNPPAWASDMVDSLIDSLVWGAHPTNPAALAARHEAYDDGLDRTDPSTRATLFACWKPYLSKAVAATGPEGLVRLAESLDDAV